MSVQFDEEVVAPVRRSQERPQSVFTRTVMKFKLAKTEKGAERLLLAVGLLSLAAAFFVFFDLGGAAGSAPSPVPSAQWPA
jgi:hypothetical protein